MIISLPDTTTSQIANALIQAQENFSLSSGRVLTLLVAARDTEDSDKILETVRAATREHPARVLVLLLGDETAPTSMNADLIVAAHSGASEMVVMRLFGDLTHHLGAVVTPLLLPDTPIVAWWPNEAPSRPKEAELGSIAQRRITNAHSDASGDQLRARTDGYQPGDSDLAWSRITPWRGAVASALDRYHDDPVKSVHIDGPADDPSVDIAAGWLAACLNVDVTRGTGDSTSDSTNDSAVHGAPITRLTLHCGGGDVTVEVVDDNTARITVPGSPDSYVALSARTDAECLAEELRHLDNDVTYARALRGLSGVTRATEQ
ncbi:MULTISPECIES: glucose-6-phosphate dehydrogenase assembly protein OpcA [Corynebacterium]|uniref:Oxppcycle protein OpcA n=1 Tax=Corynebacterium hadale TaxID=2026255 RepID=A0A269PDU2_9CORY|nr:glucose-6-phosphate dehydrogenase assembly protein OpcA [Corynebacterium hadale]PAJ70222.1 oxppcycle protein OpcA [Corynebacterium hadale]PAT09223.1 oxppcycle protein OpcA [Corynebacterium hadale]PAT10934.1 oxppcycle protein OpcA [Corynebacterium hadale]WKC60179.1 Glucose-6-phosphate dehydrogenase subunit [Corynebacterium hadale]